jgi:hypothetical protein
LSAKNIKLLAFHSSTLNSKALREKKKTLGIPKFDIEFWSAEKIYSNLILVAISTTPSFGVQRKKTFHNSKVWH